MMQLRSTRAEIHRGIKRLVNGKAVSECDIVEEFLKPDNPLRMCKLESLFKRMWVEQTVPTD
jgi:hypothetical protein